MKLILLLFSLSAYGIPTKQEVPIAKEYDIIVKDLPAPFKDAPVAKPIPFAKDADKFFVLDLHALGLYGHSFDLEKFKLGRLKDPSYVFEVSVSHLTPWGILKGSSLQYLYFDKNMYLQKPFEQVYGTYNFKDKVYVSQKAKNDGIEDGPEKNDPLFNHFVVHLGEVAEISKQPFRYDWDSADGFAYLGKERKLKTSVPLKLEFKPVPKTDLIYIPVFTDGFVYNLREKDTLEEANILGHRLLRKTHHFRTQPGEPKMSSVNYWIHSKSGELEDFSYDEGIFLGPFNWIDESQVFYVERIPKYVTHGFPRCFALYILSKDKAEKVNLPCRSDFFPDKPNMIEE